MNESAPVGRRRRPPAPGGVGTTSEDSGPEQGESAPSDAEQREAARAIVLRQLAASAKSRRQLEEKLAAREIPERVAREVLDRFEEVNLVDDRAFASMLVRSRAESRRLSRSALRRELAQRGITGDLAEEALDQRTDEDELRDAHHLVRKKLPARVDPGDRKECDRLTRRLVSMLGRKGYPSGLAFTVVKEELATLDAMPDGGATESGGAGPDMSGAEVWDTP